MLMGALLCAWKHGSWWLGETTQARCVYTFAIYKFWHSSLLFRNGFDDIGHVSKPPYPPPKLSFTSECGRLSRGPLRFVHTRCLPCVSSGMTFFRTSSIPFSL